VNWPKSDLSKEKCLGLDDDDDDDDETRDTQIQKV
jgi:hypothetical protein